MRRRLLLLGTVVAAVLAVVAVLATGLGRDPSANASPLVGRTAPDFTLGGIEGPAVTLSRCEPAMMTLRGNGVGSFYARTASMTRPCEIGSGLPSTSRTIVSGWKPRR